MLTSVDGSLEIPLCCEGNLGKVEVGGMIPPHVLVVGNESATLHSVSAMLASISYCAEESTLDAEALARVCCDPAPDLVLLELGNGNSQGLPLLRQLRAMWPDLAIVVLSASGNDEEVAEAIRLGAQDCLNVPLQESELQHMLLRYQDGEAGAAEPRRSEQARNLKTLVRNRKFETEIEEITKALEQTRWNRTAAARLLKISYRGLLYKIRQHGIARLPGGETTSGVINGNFN